MTTKLTNTLIIVILIISFGAGALLWNRLPDTMASHWNAAGLVDGSMGKFWGLFLMPITATGLFLLFLIIPQIDPLKANIAQFRRTFNLFILFMILFLGYVWKLTIFWNLGYTGFNMGTALLPAMGLLFMFIAYLLRQAKRNWFIGIRTPWTLSSDTVWRKTHDLGAVLYFASGLLALIGVLFGKNAIWFVLVPILFSTFFLIAYSYILYRQETQV